MNYTQISSRLQEITENTFTTDQIAMFVQAVEEKVYRLTPLPSTSKTSTSSLALGNRFLELPVDFVDAQHLRITTAGSEDFLVNKDPDFLREAYPSNMNDLGAPKYYAQFDKDSIYVAPTPDANYDVELRYLQLPVSIVDEETTWLGDNFGNLVLNGAVVEAYRFMRGASEQMEKFQKAFDESLALLNDYAVGKTQRDAYRSGKPRNLVRRS